MSLLLAAKKKLLMTRGGFPTIAMVAGLYGTNTYGYGRPPVLPTPTGTITGSPFPGTEIFGLLSQTGYSDITVSTDVRPLLTGRSLSVNGVLYPFSTATASFSNNRTNIAWNSGGPAYVNGGN